MTESEVGPKGWRCRDAVLPVRHRPHVMGILNVTPDSFSEQGAFFNPDDAIKKGIEMSAQGADIIDIGGESTRPGAEPVSEADEIDRVVPVLKGLASEIQTPLSIDTTKAAVAAAALDAGAVIVNDVSAMRFDPAMKKIAADSGAGVVLMHMKGEPRTMQADPRYGDVVAEVTRALLQWGKQAEEAGIASESIVADPGIGFGKTPLHNLLLIKAIGELARGAYPVLLGPSRKSFIGTVLDLPVQDRLEGTAAVVAWAVAAGVQIVRVHDVREMVRVVKMVDAIKNAGPSQ